MKSKTKIIKKPTGAIKKLGAISASMRGANSVKVGLPRGSNQYPDGTSVIKVGITHEFGSSGSGIPQRSFLRSTMHDKRREYKQVFRQLASGIVDGRMTSEEALNLLGLRVQTDVIEKITNIKLIDTGHLRQSIVFEVE